MSNNESKKYLVTGLFLASIMLLCVFFDWIAIDIYSFSQSFKLWEAIYGLGKLTDYVETAEIVYFSLLLVFVLISILGFFISVALGTFKALYYYHDEPNAINLKPMFIWGALTTLATGVVWGVITTVNTSITKVMTEYLDISDIFGNYSMNFKIITVTFSEKLYFILGIALLIDLVLYKRTLK